jgi:hypothetical protein
MKPVKISILSAAFALFCSANVAAQQVPLQPVNVNYTYADVADLALASSIVAHVRIRTAKRLGPDLSAGLAPGHVRHLVSADVIALVRGNEGLAPRISYIIDLPSDSRGKIAKITKSEMFVFAVPARAGEVRLVAPDAQINWSAPTAQLVRAILSEENRAGAPPIVTGVSSGFHSAGALAGEGETQIFLATKADRPASIGISRRSGSAPNWYVSTAEVVDDSAGRPPRNSLLWYRLACFLPAALPDSAVAELPATDASAVRADYQLVMGALGICPRTRLKR